MKVHGPYYRNDGRQHVVIVHDDGRKQTKSYPKYLLEQKLGRELVGDETCDHRDENFTNDDLDNLQVLTRAENAAKAMIGREAEMYHFDCPACRRPCVRPWRDVRYNWKIGKAGPVCSKECAGLLGKNITLHQTTYDYDRDTDILIIENNSWQID